MALRSAEKSRESICAFADAIARASIDTYRRTAPRDVQDGMRQTVLASFVLRREPMPGSGEGEGAMPTLEVVAYGVGTKYVVVHCCLERRNAWQ